MEPAWELSDLCLHKFHAFLGNSVNNNGAVRIRLCFSHHLRSTFRLAGKFTVFIIQRKLVSVCTWPYPEKTLNNMKSKTCPRIPAGFDYAGKYGGL